MNELSPRIIRAWFDTILNPIIEGLETEKVFLERNNLTWRGFNATFEVLKPLHVMYHYRYHANFEQCVAFNSEILDVIIKHDGLLKDLNKSCSDLFDVLKNSQKLKELYIDARTENEQKNPGIDASFIKDLADVNNYRFIAEYIINDKGDLENSYTLSPIWNSYKDRFKELLNDETVVLLVKIKDVAFDSFKNGVNESLQSFKRIRNELSIHYGEPIVTVQE